MIESMPGELFEALGNTSIKSKLLLTLVNVRPTITQQDIERKVKTRYFAKYAAQRKGQIYEITNITFGAIQNNSLFRKTSIDWIIRGKLQDTVLTLPTGDNILIKGIISQNKVLLALAEEELPGITNHLRNYMEFYSGE